MVRTKSIRTLCFLRKEVIAVFSRGFFEDKNFEQPQETGSEIRDHGDVVA
ncbi:MAG: hypothetical protein AAF717_12915 [Bacteroidota bacterium]